MLSKDWLLWISGSEMMGLALAALAEQMVDRHVQKKRRKGQEKKRHERIEPKSSDSKESSM